MRYSKRRRRGVVGRPSPAAKSNLEVGLFLAHTGFMFAAVVVFPEIAWVFVFLWLAHGLWTASGPR